MPVSTDWAEKLQREAFALGGAANNRTLRQHREREPSLDDFRLPHETAEESKARFKQVSKANINALFEWRPATAKELGLESRWLKRLCGEGLGFASKKTLDRLVKLADHFSLMHYTQLWRDDLLGVIGLPGPARAQVHALMQSPHWRHAERLVQLLGTGSHNHLASLIDDLFELELGRSARSASKKSKPKKLTDYMNRKKPSADRPSDL